MRQDSWKEFLNYSEFHHEFWRSHVETDVRCHRKVGEQSGRSQLLGQISVEKEFLETAVIDWWWNSHQSFKHKSLSSRILCCASEGFFNILNPTKFGRTIAGIQSEKSYRDVDGINGEPTEFEWNIFPGFTTLQLCDKINNLLITLGQTPKPFTGRNLFMSMFNDIICERKRQQRRMFGKCRNRASTCEKVWYWTMVFYLTRFWKELLFFRE